MKSKRSMITMIVMGSGLQPTHMLDVPNEPYQSLKPIKI